LTFYSASGHVSIELSWFQPLASLTFVLRKKNLYETLNKYLTEPAEGTELFLFFSLRTLRTL